MNLLAQIKARRKEYQQQIRNLQETGDCYGAAYLSLLAVVSELDYIILLGEHIPLRVYNSESSYQDAKNHNPSLGDR